MSASSNGQNHVQMVCSSPFCCVQRAGTVYIVDGNVDGSKVLRLIACTAVPTHSNAKPEDDFMVFPPP